MYKRHGTPKHAGRHRADDGFDSVRYATRRNLFREARQRSVVFKIVREREDPRTMALALIGGSDPGVRLGAIGRS